MTNGPLYHRGYYGSVEFSEYDDLWHGGTQGISDKDSVSYGSETKEDIKASFNNSVDEYIDYCK